MAESRTTARRILPNRTIDPGSDFANPDVEADYIRTVAQLENMPDPEYEGCLSLKDVLRAHYLIGDFFYSEGFGMGGLGPRDMGLLQSAVHRQHVGYGGKLKWEDKFHVCATLLFGLVKDHPFHDANKRTAMLASMHHLARQKRTPTVTHLELENFVVDIAENRLSKYTRFQEFISEGVADPEVHMIAFYLRRHTRQIDNRQYTITYWDLRRILNRFGFEMQNPSNNSIDVVRLEEVRRFFHTRIEKRFVTRIRFPSWTKQVDANTLNRVREATGLTYKENGIDSKDFFFGTEEVRLLIAHYQEPLRRLADR